MMKRYIKPETTTFMMEQQQSIMAGSDFIINSGAEPINGNQGLAKDFYFFAFEEEEVRRTTDNNDDDWEEWEEENL